MRHRIMRAKLALLAICVAIPTVTRAQTVHPAAVASPAASVVLRAGSAPTGVRLDGLLGDSSWLTADSAELREVEPRQGAAPTGRTVVRVLASADALLIGIRADDPDPSGIVSFARQRDAELKSEDHIEIVLDTYLDGRSGYVFAVNPGGARYDGLVTGEGLSTNSNWDGAWRAATARTASGWSAEIRIPVKTLLFRPGLTEWGFNVERRVQRLQETDRWASPERDHEVTEMGRAGRLTGLPHFDVGIGLTVRPSLSGGGGRDTATAPFGAHGDASLDVTQRLGPNTLASLTVNTDFAETEVDTRQVNLTRFPLFFPEKRTFFLEGADIFDFGLGTEEDVVPFFSRRVGLLAGEQVPLRAGGKVNGRVGGTNFGALVVRTGALDTLAPPATMAVMRVKQNVLRESSVGVIATLGDPLGRPGSWLAGSDLTYRTSRFRGDKNLLAGVWALALGRSDLSGGDRTAAGLTISYPNDLWDVSLGYKRIGDAFDPSLGFVPRTGVHLANVSYTWQPRPRHPLGPLRIRQCFWENEVSYVAGLAGGWQSYRYFMAPINCRLESGDRFEFNIVPEGERLAEPFEIADAVTIPTGSYHFWRFRLEGGLAAKRRLSAQATWWFGGFYDGRLDQLELTASWRPTPLLIVELGGEHDIGRLTEGSFTQDAVNTRLRLNVSPDLGITSLLQYDDESRSIGTNTRLRWSFSPLGDVFIVYNHNLRTRDPLTLRRGLTFESNQLSVKLQYAFRY